MGKSTLDVLIEARRLIEKPENWNNHSVGATARGYSTGPMSADAFSRCSRGALIAAIGGYNDRQESALASMIVKAASFRSRIYTKDSVAALCEWNNTHPHSEVLAAFDKAIEAERVKAGAT